MWDPHGHLIIFSISIFILFLSYLVLTSYLLPCLLIHSKWFFSKKSYYHYQLENPNISSLSHFPQEVKLQNILSKSLEKNPKNLMLQNKKRLCMCVTAVYSTSISLSLRCTHVLGLFFLSCKASLMK